MGHEDKQVQHNFSYEENFKEDVYYCPLMQDLFFQWTTLNAKQQTLLNYAALYIFDKDEMIIFSSVIKGVSYWNTIQDTEGACGYHKNPLEFRFDKEQEKRIFQVIVDANKITTSIKNKVTLCYQINSLKVSYQSGKLKFSKVHNDSGDT